MVARIISEKIRMGLTGSAGPMWSKNPFARTGLIARLRGMNRKSRKCVREALKLQQKGELQLAVVKFQLATSNGIGWQFGLDLRERSAHLLHKIARKKPHPGDKAVALRTAAEEYFLAAKYATTNAVASKKIAISLYLCARDIYEEIGDAKLAQKAYGAALALTE